MNVLPAAIVLLAFVSMTVSAAVGVGRERLLRTFEPLSPKARAWWLLGVLSAPLLCSGVLVVLALAHCVGLRATGLPDDCTGFGGVCSFCVFGGADMTLRGWFLMSLALVPVFWGIVRLVRGWWHMRVARLRIRSIAKVRDDGAWSVPGSRAFVLGWVEPVVCVGENLADSLDPSAVEAVTAHEEAHRSSGDTLFRAAAQFVSVAHLPTVARPLLAALDLAVEQACDERASHCVKDRLVVAQALIDTARLQADDHAACWVPASLPERVASLCAPPRLHAAPTWAPAFGITLLGTLAVAVVLNHELHSAFERLSVVFTR